LGKVLKKRCDDEWDPQRLGSLGLPPENLRGSKIEQVDDIIAATRLTSNDVNCDSMP
jgi:hypothetical protein